MNNFPKILIFFSRRFLICRLFFRSPKPTRMEGFKILKYFNWSLKNHHVTWFMALAKIWIIFQATGLLIIRTCLILLFLCVLCLLWIFYSSAAVHFWEIVWLKVILSEKNCVNFWPDRNHFERRTHRKSAITGLKFKKRNLTLHAELNIWFDGVYKNEKAVILK